MSEDSTQPQTTQPQRTWHEMDETQVDETQDAPSMWGEGRHPIHITHLVMGTIFAGLLVVWALLYGGAAGGDDVRWLLPLPWLLAGGAGLAAAGRNARRRS